MTHPLRFALLALVALLALRPGAAPAAVVASGAGGFVVREEAVYAGDPAAAWRRLVRPQDWWDPEHTYSRDARNLSLALDPGGCWCERLAHGGFVRHREVLYVSPRETLRLGGGLGPLQRMGVGGALTFTLKAEGPGATRVVAEYAVSGYAPDGLAAIAGAVDQVLGAQLARFAAPR
jgi:hypothetical protein